MMSHYAADVVAFDAIAALQFKGAEAYRKNRYETLLRHVFGPHDFSRSTTSTSRRGMTWPSATISSTAAVQGQTARNIAAGCA